VTEVPGKKEVYHGVRSWLLLLGVPIPIVILIALLGHYERLK
jgi:hypothetical protein